MSLLTELYQALDENTKALEDLGPLTFITIERRIELLQAREHIQKSIMALQVIEINRYRKVG